MCSTRSGRLLALLVGFSLLAACGDSVSTETAAATTTAAVTTTTAATTTTTEATTPDPGRVFVHGRANCDFPDATMTVEGEWDVYTGTLLCTDTMSDPRVTGVEAMEITLWTSEELRIHKFVTSSDTLTNDGGTWRGEAFGSEFFDEDGNLFTSGYARLVGEGGYEGLVYNVFFAQGPGLANPANPDESYLYSGWIEPAE